MPEGGRENEGARSYGMKITLVQAPAWATATPPVAIASLAAFLRGRGHEVTALDLNIELHKKLGKVSPAAWDLIGAKSHLGDPDAAAAFIRRHAKELKAQAGRILAGGAELVGFSIYQSSLYVSLHLAGLIKKKNPRVLVVFGGPHASRDHEGFSLARNRNVDFVVQGEGELTLAEIAENRKAKVFRGALMRRGGKVLDCGDREQVRDLDSLPFPDLSDYNLSDYAGPFRVPVSFSRGCCNRCVYCTDHLYWRGFRSRSAASVYAEIKQRLSENPKETFFFFQDSLVNGNMRELEKLADLLIKGRLKIRWHGQAVIRREMTLPLLRKLRRSGCMGLAYGVETASPALMLRSGKLLAKGADADRIVRDGARAGIGAIVNLMFGLPGETEEDFRRTLDFVRRNKDNVLLIPQQTFCSVYEGTRAHKDPAGLGIDLSDNDYWRSTDGTNTYPVRLRRFEELCRLAYELKVPSFYPLPYLADRNTRLAGYYLFDGDIAKALEHTALAVKEEGLEISAFLRLKAASRKAGLGLAYEERLAELRRWKRSAHGPARRPPEQPDISALVRGELEREAKS